MSADASTVVEGHRVDSASELRFWLFVAKQYGDHQATALTVLPADLFAMPTIAQLVVQAAVAWRESCRLLRTRPPHPRYLKEAVPTNASCCARVRGKTRTLWLVRGRSKDILGRVYEYFLGQFAAAEGKKGGQFYTAQSVVKLLVEMIEPYKGRVFDPCCGSGGMFVQSEKFAEAHGGRRTDLSIYGQESNQTTWRLCKMNLAIRGIESNIAWNSEGSFHNDAHKDLKADFILANPPFNDSDWGGERLREDVRWKYGGPPTGNANFAWVQHFISHLAPNGTAGFVLANGSMSSNQSGEGEIRKAIIEADLVDCMLALPGQLFYTTPIPVCLRFLTRNKSHGKFRDRRRQTLFLDARKMGQLVDRTHRELSEEEIARLGRTYHAWRGEKDAGRYEDIPGFCKSAANEEIAAHGYILTPGRHVGAEEVEDDGEPFHEKMKRLTAKLESQFADSSKLEQLIRENLKGLQHGR